MDHLKLFVYGLFEDIWDLVGLGTPSVQQEAPESCGRYFLWCGRL